MTFEQLLQRHQRRYESIKRYADKFEITRTPGYAHYRYEATTTDPVAMGLSALDVALIVDGGNLCFGGRNYTNDGHGKYSGVIHTD